MKLQIGLVLWICLSFTLNINGQYKSILSASGEGRNLSSVFSTNRLVGGLSAAYSSSNVCNFQNPASFADASLTAFEIGAFGESGSYDLGDSNKSSGGVGLSHFSILLPMTVGKSGMSIGFYRNTTTDYGLESNSIDPLFGAMSNIRTGSGNTYNAFIGMGFRFKNLKVGGNLIPQFGHVSYIEDVKFADSLRIPSIRERASVSNFGLSYNFGLQYDVELSKSQQLLLGTYYTGNILSSASSQSLKQNIYRIGTFTERYVTIEDTTKDIELPTSSKFGLGLSFITKKALLIGTEFNTTIYSNFKNRLDSSSLQNAWNIHLGLEYRPGLNRDNDGRKYLNRLSYRLGATAGKNEFNLGSSINDFKIMAGATFPILSRSVGYLTTGLEFQHSSNNGLKNISEDILTLRLILTFADKWFIRSKFD